jgi:hypothetical protein
MKNHYLWIAIALLALGLGACRTTAPFQDTPTRQPVAVSTRWIGVEKHGKGCPAPTLASGWTVRPLFPLNGVPQDLRQSYSRAGLGRFCVYDYTGYAPHPNLPVAIQVKLSAAEPDRAVLVSSADTLAGMTSPSFLERFSDGVGRLDSNPAAAGVPPGVRLAILDSQPTQGAIPTIPGSSEHGYILSHMAAYLACPGGQSSCAVEIVSRLALPMVSFANGQETKDEISGGYRGTFEDLNQALWDEIVAWQQSPGAAKHLVLNLSLGWDGEKYGGREAEVKDMPPAVQAIYRVLEAAADQGILVIAAAGNELPGPEATIQPLLPAGWEARPRGGARPLVYAASGVDGGDHPLVNTRAKGEAPRVAYADHAVVGNFWNNRLTTTLTGSSVASAVVSTTAAMVWSARPDLQPEKVMQILSQSGIELSSRTPDFWAPSDPAPGPVRRISLCRAMQKACDEGNCPLPVCAVPTTHTSLEEVLSTLQPTTTLAALQGFNSPQSHHKNLLEQPWICPQPGVDPCPNCAVTGPGGPGGPPVATLALPSIALASYRTGTTTVSPYKLRMEIPSSWNGGMLQDATLEVFDFDNMGRKKFRTACSIEAGNLIQNGATLEVSELCFEELAEPFQAALSFTVSPPPGASDPSPLSIYSPLFVEYPADKP